MAPDDQATAPAAALSTTAPTQARTGFLDLSAELRNEIYYLALVQNRDVHIRRTGNPQRRWSGYITDASKGVFINGSRMKFSTDELGINAALLRVDRQVYSEAKPVLYGTNTFAIDGSDVFVCLPESARLVLKRLKITGAWTFPFDHIVTRLKALASHMKLSKLEFALDAVPDKKPQHKRSLR